MARPITLLELFTVRLMIGLGSVSMILVLKTVFSVSVRGAPALYWMLMITFIYLCLKTLYEWYHYFSITVPEIPAATKVYTVDIFTTFCAGEPYDMIEETLTAIQAITYPHKAYLCDESDDPYLRHLCTNLNVNHVTRIEKKNAKAGNINNALNQSSGELCVVLDPDHVPFPDFLDPVVSHFADPDIGFVQIVQAYKNMEDGLIARGAAQQTYQFYGPMMMTMNNYGTVLAIGANCTFRRAALESIGGHAAGLAEDLHTSMQLHAKGWKSVYVPRILARGLVPSTLSAYYQQQLKWSRGVFDLLVIAYPKLFSQFTWRQKLHYAIIPLHYLSGIIFLINFLIPILSLVLDESPMIITLTEFGAAVLPFLAAVILIRHYTQKWVMEDKERGFHIIGGLLMTGTWWIYILGFVYTILRKKVPYIPTPKDSYEENNWALNIPNFIVLISSLAAIIYGLNIDLSPYTIIMSMFAGMNCLIMLFNIIVSRQHQFKLYRKKHPRLNHVMRSIHKQRINFWIVRMYVYKAIRGMALWITVVLTGYTIYYYNFKPKNVPPVHAAVKKSPYLLGIFYPENQSGITSVQSVKQLGSHFDIISVYIPWGVKPVCFLPEKTIDSIYQNGSIPMITWEPWQNMFDTLPVRGTGFKDQKVFSKIISGRYDWYITKFSNQVKSLDRPVYIRFAHETDNPFYPWSQTGNNTAEEFKTAWKYLHKRFADNGVNNVIWVWNPWKPEAVTSYFPGKKYVDWIGVTSLNYSHGKEWQSMEDLYKPFHKHPVFRSGIPVMLAEMGSLRTGGKQGLWYKQAFTAAVMKFPEIKGFVLFNSAFDKNLPSGNDPGSTALNWKIEDFGALASLIPDRQEPVRKSVPALPDLPKSLSDKHIQTDSVNYYIATHGVNYTKGQNWRTNKKAFTIQEMTADFIEMKKTGINTIKWNGPGIYERNVVKTAEKLNMNIHYSFWISDKIDFVKDTIKLKVLSSSILSCVERLKDKKQITSWNIGNTVFQKLDSLYYKPELIYQKGAYLLWLRQLVINIKKIDPARNVTLNVAVSTDTPDIIDRIRRSIKEIDSYGLVLNDKKFIPQLKRIKAPYFFSYVSATDYLKLKNTDTGAFITDWQDRETTSFVDFDGLTDQWGRKKMPLLQLRNRWKNTRYPEKTARIKILKPSLVTTPGKELIYHAIIQAGNEWKVISPEYKELQFEWKLVHCDQAGVPLTIKELEKGPELKIIISENDPSAYRLYLYILQGNVVINIVTSTLNTPLINPLQAKN